MIFHSKIQRALRLLQERSAARRGDAGLPGAERPSDLPGLERGDFTALVLAGFLVLSPVFLLLLLLVWLLL